MSSTRPPVDHAASSSAIDAIKPLVARIEALRLLHGNVDAPTMRAATEGWRNYLVSALWDLRSDPNRGGLCAKPPSEQEIEERRSILHRCFELLADPDLQTSTIGHAMTLASSLIYASETQHITIEDGLKLAQLCTDAWRKRGISAGATIDFTRFYSNIGIFATRHLSSPHAESVLQLVVDSLEEAPFDAGSLISANAKHVLDAYGSLYYSQRNADINVSTTGKTVFTCNLVPQSYRLADPASRLAFLSYALLAADARTGRDSSDLWEKAGAELRAMTADRSEKFAGQVTNIVRASIFEDDPDRDRARALVEQLKAFFAGREGPGLLKALVDICQHDLPSKLRVSRTMVEDYLPLLAETADQEDAPSGALMALVALLTQFAIDGQVPLLKEVIVALASATRSSGRQIAAFRTIAAVAQTPAFTAVDIENLAALTEVPYAGSVQGSEVEAARLAAIGALLDLEDIEIDPVRWFSLLELDS